MKKAFLQIFLAVLCFSAQAQKVSNIRAEQRGQEIVVLYSLETTAPCEVSLLLSQDNGVTWGSPLKNVSGDVGNYISSGQRHITWKVLEECEQLVGDKLKFKVIAFNRNTLASTDLEMVFVEGSTFQMGINSAHGNQNPAHGVTLSSYYIGKYEITQAQWRAVMGEQEILTGCDDCPIGGVSRNAIQEYLLNLNAKTGKNYRLPTEAEWEYAAKGGKSSKGFTYSGSNDLNAVAWNEDNSGSRTHAVGSKQANELGIYDMSGNVSEYCSDYYGKYSNFNEFNPTGASSGNGRVYRGGSYQSPSLSSTTTFRSTGPAYGYGGYIVSGFRLVLPAE